MQGAMVCLGALGETKVAFDWHISSRLFHLPLQAEEGHQLPLGPPCGWRDKHPSLPLRSPLDTRRVTAVPYACPIAR